MWFTSVLAVPFDIIKKNKIIGKLFEWPSKVWMPSARYSRRAVKVIL